jgi:mono/diheme cytochrome c family protein
VLVLAIAGATLGGCEPGEMPHDEVPELSEAELAEARQIYVQYCQSCHPDGQRGAGPRLQNRPIPAPIIYDRVRNGRRAMPAFGRDQIDEREMELLVGYILNLRHGGG